MRTAPLIAIAAAHLALLAAPVGAADYYISPAGSDSAAGSATSPWRSIAKVNATVLRPGDRVLFQGGQRFAGKISLDANDGGSATSPVLIGSYGTGRALIDGGTGDALIAYNCAGFDIRGIDFVGAGTAANAGSGINFYTDLATGAKLAHLRIDSVDCTG